MGNKIIKCLDCQQDFVWTEGEQQFYQEKELAEPSRCPICRAIYRKASQDQFRGQVKK